MSTADRLRQLDACDPAVAWIGDRTPAEAWAECPRGDWILWTTVRLNADRRLIVLAACDCARAALPYVLEGETRPLRAIETGEAWTRGDATLDEVRAAARAAARAAIDYEAANAAPEARAAAHAAARAAARAASLADYTTNDSDAACDAAAVTLAAARAEAIVAEDAAYAADHVDYDCDTYDAARAASLARSADIVRARIPWALIELLWRATVTARKPPMQTTRRPQ